MSLKKIFLTVALTGAVLVAGAQPRPAAPQRDAAANDNKKDEAVELAVKPGLMGVGQHENDWYLEVPDSLLGRRMLAVTRFVSNTVDAGTYGGEEVNEQMIYWEKAANGNLLLRADVLSIHSAADQEIRKAVDVSSENPIVASFKPEKGASAGTTRIKVTSLFGGDTQVFALSPGDKRGFNLGALKADASFINSIRTYPINTEVTVTKTYAYNTPSGGPGGGSGAPQGQQSRNLPAGRASGSVTVVLNTSILLLPETPMQQRWFDPRVGFFAGGYSEFSDEQQEVEQIRFITRWRLEARPEDVERQKRGEAVEPIKPIVYYIDPATPKQWRPYLIAGVNDWQVAFEQAGWKNAIHAEEWPEDSTMSLEDARFAVIRYLASPIANAYGPNVHDPRSGEILESHIGWYHNVMTLVHDWYQVQAGAVDPRARSIKYSDELMGDLIRFVSSHEVGHTLGLRHNMGSSSQTPVEKLRDKAWVEAHGHTVSIMDYARFNYVAQPEDGITKAGLYPRINDYDKWAIEFGYSPSLYDDPKEDHLYWNKVIIARLQENPRLWFGGEGRDGDPRAQTEDLGDDAVAASRYGILNLQRVIKEVPAWNVEESDMYANVSRMYDAVLSQFGRYMGHVAMNIGGRFITNKSIEESGPKYEPVPKERQVAALDFLDEQLFRKPTWLVDVPYIFNITDRPDSYLYSQVDRVVSASNLLSIDKLTRLGQFAQYDPSAYKPEDYLSDLTGRIFSELGRGAAVDSYRRYLQRRFVTAALDVIASPAAATADGRTLLLATVMDLRARAAKAKASDPATRAHWQALVLQIDTALKLK